MLGVAGMSSQQWLLYPSHAPHSCWQTLWLLKPPKDRAKSIPSSQIRAAFKQCCDRAMTPISTELGKFFARVPESGKFGPGARIVL
jgi:hypothetical protein